MFGHLGMLQKRVRNAVKLVKWLVSRYEMSYMGCSDSLETFCKAEQINSRLSGARVNLQLTSRPLHSFSWARHFLAN